MFFFLNLFYFANATFLYKKELSEKISSLECERNNEISELNDLIEIIRRNQNFDTIFSTYCIDKKRSNIQDLNKTIFDLKKTLENANK